MTRRTAPALRGVVVYCAFGVYLQPNQLVCRGSALWGGCLFFVCHCWAYRWCTTDVMRCQAMRQRNEICSRGKLYTGRRFKETKENLTLNYRDPEFEVCDRAAVRRVLWGFGGCSVRHTA